MQQLFNTAGAALWSRSMSGMRVPVSPLTTRHRHTALLRPYTLGHRVVSCGDYATFIADGGLPAACIVALGRLGAGHCTGVACTLVLADG